MEETNNDKPIQKPNKIIAIGFLSDYNCYLNVSMEEAKKRWLSVFAKEKSFYCEEITIKEIEFNDEFLAYDIEGADKCYDWNVTRETYTEFGF